MTHPLVSRASVRILRNHVAWVAVALSLLSFVAYLMLLVAYHSSHPRTPVTGLGMVYPSNNHGSYVYLTKAEATGLSLLMDAFVVGVFVIFVVIPKEFVIVPRSRFSRFPVTIKYDTPTLSMKLVALCSAALYLVMIICFGHSIAEFVISRGISVPVW